MLKINWKEVVVAYPIFACGSELNQDGCVPIDIETGL
jgi:hypothetical protein